MPENLKNLFKQVRTGDIWGGLAASAVVLPQAMAFGVALLVPFGIDSVQGAMPGLLAAAMLCIASGIVRWYPGINQCPDRTRISPACRCAGNNPCLWPHWGCTYVESCCKCTSCPDYDGRLCGRCYIYTKMCSNNFSTRDNSTNECNNQNKPVPLQIYMRGNPGHRINVDREC